MRTDNPVVIQMSQKVSLGLRMLAGLQGVLLHRPHGCVGCVAPRAVINCALLSPAGCNGPWPVLGVLGRHACRPCYSTKPTGPSGVASLPGRRVHMELEEMLVPRKMSISPLESWLTIRYLLPRLDTGAPGTVSPAQLYECPPSQVGEGVEQGGKDVFDAPQMQCRNVLKIRRRKMNHHKYRKLVKRTRFLRRKVREARLKRKQVSMALGCNYVGWLECVVMPQTCWWSLPLPSQMKFERDLWRIWQKAGLKEAPPGWQTPKIYLKGK